MMMARALSFVLLFSCFAQAKELSIDQSKSWSDFETIMQEQERRDEVNGISYMISGGVLVLGGLVGYHNSQGSLEKMSYSLIQSLGVAGFSYGYYLHQMGSSHTQFYNTVASTKSLTISQKDELLLRYIDNTREQNYNTKLIRVITHGALAALNIYNGNKEKDADLRQALYFIGGINALAAISFSFQ